VDGVKSGETERRGGARTTSGRLRNTETLPPQHNTLSFVPAPTWPRDHAAIRTALPVNVEQALQEGA